MSIPTLSGKGLATTTGESFLSEKFLPWFFIAAINIAIYELAVADGHSIFAGLQSLDDFDQGLVFLLFLASVGAIAAISSAASGLILSFFGARPDYELEKEIVQTANEKRKQHLLDYLDRSQTDVINMGTLFFGLCVTLCAQALLLLAWQENPLLSLICLSAICLILLMTGLLAKSQARRAVYALDELGKQISTRQAAVHNGSINPRFNIFLALLVLIILVILGTFSAILAGYIGSPRGYLAYTAPRTTVLLAINDIYRLTGPDRGVGGGGLARVRTLRTKLESTHPDLLLLHAGDFLSPSLLGNTYKGEHMVDIMNQLDGDPRPGSIDPRMFVTFGNHEFDDTHCTKKGPLSRRIRESDFTYIASNLVFANARSDGGNCPDLHEVADDVPAGKIVPFKIVESGGLKLGIYGLTINKDAYSPIVESSAAKKSCEMVKKLRKEGVDAVIALTHLAKDTDLGLLGLGPDGQPLERPDCPVSPDVVIGGHDHTSMALPENGNPRIFKADADAVSAYRISIAVNSAGKVSVNGIKISLVDAESDAHVHAASEAWFKRHDERYCMSKCTGLSDKPLEECKAMVPEGGCLKAEIAKLNTILDAEEVKNREQETGFGNWFMDRIIEASGAEVALFNSGGIRLNYNIDQGRTVILRHLVEMFPYETNLVVAEVPESILWNAVNVGFSKSGEGAWLHFGGLAAKRAADGSLERLVLLTGENTGRLITRKGTGRVRAASSAFVFANGDKHGFEFCSEGDKKCEKRILKENQENWPKGTTNNASELVQSYMKRSGHTGGISFNRDRRICEQDMTDWLIDKIRVTD